MKVTSLHIYALQLIAQVSIIFTNWYQIYLNVFYSIIWKKKNFHGIFYLVKEIFSIEFGHLSVCDSLILGYVIIDKKTGSICKITFLSEFYAKPYFCLMYILMKFHKLFRYVTPAVSIVKIYQYFSTFTLLFSMVLLEYFNNCKYILAYASNTKCRHLNIQNGSEFINKFITFASNYYSSIIPVLYILILETRKKIPTFIFFHE